MRALNKLRLAKIRYLLLFIVAIAIVASIPNPAISFSFQPKVGRKIKGIPHVPDLPPCDLKDKAVSRDALPLADLLKLTEPLRQLQTLRDQAQSYPVGSVPHELHEQIRDLKEDITDKIEQTRLEIDFTQAELAVDIAIQSELLRAYSEDRDKKVNAATVWGLRTNGVLWAIAESLDIPTYKQPRYAIPSGSIGIVAGVVPGLFSLLAVHEEKGDRYQGKTRPNMLSKIFGYPTTPQIEFPDSIMAYLRTVPVKVPGGQPRLDYLISRWEVDENIHSFTDIHSKQQLDVITGAVESNLTIQIVSDRLTMLQQLSAVVYQINRPLLELMMVVTGTKRIN